MSRSIILDCDPGHDDAFAIMMAGADPRVNLLAVTTVAGNAEIEKTTRNARQICEYIGLSDVPVYRGADGPLLRDQLTATHVHGASGLSGADLPELKQPMAEDHAVDMIIEMVRHHTTPITLVPIGPLTNIAMALRKAPDIVGNIADIVLMGGGYRGNHTPAAEFNILADPEAASIVFDSGVPIVMCPLEVTKQSVATEAERKKIAAMDGEVAQFASRLLYFADENYRQLFGHGNPAIHDAVAVAYCCDPSVMTTQEARVDVELHGIYTYGMTVIDTDHKSDRKNNAIIGCHLAAATFWEMMSASFASLSRGESSWPQR